MSHYQPKLISNLELLHQIDIGLTPISMSYDRPTIYYMHFTYSTSLLFYYVLQLQNMVTWNYTSNLLQSKRGLIHYTLTKDGVFFRMLMIISSVFWKKSVFRSVTNKSHSYFLEEECRRNAQSSRLQPSLKNLWK